MSRTAPVNTPARERQSADLPIRSLDPIPDDPEDRAADIIVSDEKLASKDYQDELAFMAERVEIILHRGREKFSPNVHDFYVNGRPMWIPVDTPVSIPRAYLEVMARSQPYDVQTQVDKNEGDDAASAVLNTIKRYQSSKYPFAVLKDPNPKGPAWLAKVMRES